MENINAVQKGMKKFGVPPEDLFQTVDLFEKRNIPAVTSSIMALGRTCKQTSSFLFNSLFFNLCPLIDPLMIVLR